jgi:replication factor C subunit 3/5
VDRQLLVKPLRILCADVLDVNSETQACHAAYELTTESEVYQCTGNPEPADIEEIMKTMMNDSFEVAYQRESAHDTFGRSAKETGGAPLTPWSPFLFLSFLLCAGVSALKAEKGLALQDIIQGIYEFASEVTFSAPTRVYFLDQLSQVE